MTNENPESITVSPSFTVGEPVAYLKFERKVGDFNNEGVNVSIPIPVPAEGVQSQVFQPDRPCGVCGSATFNNTTSEKANPRFPDFKCKNRDCQAAMWLTGKSAGEWQKRS
jgi:hypothetical protein